MLERVSEGDSVGLGRVRLGVLWDSVSEPILVPVRDSERPDLVAEAVCDAAHVRVEDELRSDDSECVLDPASAVIVAEAVGPDCVFERLLGCVCDSDAPYVIVCDSDGDSDNVKVGDAVRVLTDEPVGEAVSEGVRVCDRGFVRLPDRVGVPSVPVAVRVVDRVLAGSLADGDLDASREAVRRLCVKALVVEGCEGDLLRVRDIVLVRGRPAVNVTGDEKETV